MSRTTGEALREAIMGEVVLHGEDVRRDAVMREEVNDPDRRAQRIAAAIVKELGITRDHAVDVGQVSRFTADYEGSRRFAHLADALTALLDCAEVEP